MSVPLKVKVTWHTAKYGDPYSEFVLCIYPSKCTHTQQWTRTHREHTPWTHTQSSGQPFMLRRPRSSWGFGALLKGTSSWFWGWRERCTLTPPPPTIPAGPRLELATFWLWVRLSTFRLPTVCEICHILGTKRLWHCAITRYWIKGMSM